MAGEGGGGGGGPGLRLRDRDLDRTMVRLEKKMTKDDLSKNGLMW